MQCKRIVADLFKKILSYQRVQQCTICSNSTISCRKHIFEINLNDNLMLIMAETDVTGTMHDDCADNFE